MDIKDCKIGTRVVCINDEGGNIPSGVLGHIIEDNHICPYVAWDEYFKDNQIEYKGHKNVCAMYLREIEVLKENTSEEDSSKETNIGKLSVSLSTDDVNSIAKDILKVVLQELYVGVENISKDLELEGEVSGDVTPKESLVTEQDVLNNLLKGINEAVINNDICLAGNLSAVYQRIKSVIINTAQSI